MGIDAIPFHHRGVPCLTFSSGSLGRAAIAVHSSADVAEHLDPSMLGRVAELARQVAQRLTG
jgi:Zn-dependent M28 family amino/carboxypeptidase